MGITPLFLFIEQSADPQLFQADRTPPAVHPGITIWVDKIEIEIYLGEDNFFEIF